MACPVCERETPTGARYCPFCGAAVETAGQADECTVVLSFDLDGPAGMMQRNPAVADQPSARSFGEYGPAVGAAHVLALLKREDVAASFYVPGWVAERYPRVVAGIAEAGHEVGHHGYLHEPPSTLSREEEAAVLDKGSAILAEVTGAAPRGYRSPSWELSGDSVSLLVERGFLYDSSLMGSDAPYWVGEEQLVELPIHWALDDYPYFVFGPGDGRRLMASPEQVYESWRAAFEEVHARGGVFTLTMHPYIIGRPGRLAMLGRLIKYMREFGEVRFARAVDVASEFGERYGG